MLALFRVVNNYVGNLPPLPAVFPDWEAPIVRTKNGERELVMARWGMPGPFQFGGAPVTKHPQYQLAALARMA